MKNSVLILLGLVLPLLAASQGTPWFNVAYSGNGNNHMTIYVAEDLIGNLKAGDEIGIFDGEICVGALVLGGPITGILELTASQADLLEENGFTSGNPIILRIYDSGLQKEFEMIEVQYYTADGNPIDEPLPVFTPNGSAIVKLAAQYPIAAPSGVIYLYSSGTYTTESGMDDYEWQVTGGTITGGQGTNSITVYWNEAGPQTVSVTWKYAGTNIPNIATLETTITARTLLDLKVFLEGPYSNSNGTMNSTLHPFMPLQQPYSSAPWNYNGNEDVVSIPANVVDWILVEMRQATAPANATSATIFARRAAFLLSNGSVVDLDGTSPLQFLNVSVSEENNLYVVIRHRNHLSIMSANALIKNTNDEHAYDFSLENNIFGGATGYKVVSGKVLKVAGDIDSDNSVFVSDYNQWAIRFGQTNIYN